MLQKTRLAIPLVLLAAALGAPSGAVGGPVPSKLVLSAVFGWKVNATTGANVCTVASGDQCQDGEQSHEVGGFSYPTGVAVQSDPGAAGYEDVYVADAGRVTELSPGGQFVREFGHKVNVTTGGDVCTAQEMSAGAQCGAATQGNAAGSFENITSLTVDPSDGELYVLDDSGRRVQAYTAEDAFLWMAGKGVNATTGANLCTAAEMQAEGVICQEAVARVQGSAEPLAFKVSQSAQPGLAVGGPADLLYVGDEGRVAKLSSTGTWEGEVSLAPVTPPHATSGALGGIAVDQAGDMYLLWTEGTSKETVGVVRELTASGQVSTVITGRGTISTIALDPYGRLGVIEAIEQRTYPYKGYNYYVLRGVLYSAAGQRISEFASPDGELAKGGSLAFSPADVAYAASYGGDHHGGAKEGEDTPDSSVEAYAPVFFPEPSTCPASEVTATSAKLCGQISPNDSQSAAFFDYGATPVLNAQTPIVFEGAQTSSQPLKYLLEGLTPNQSYSYIAVAQAEVEGVLETARGEPALTFHTTTPAPALPAPPSASYVTADSAVLGTELNPEHASTSYRFEYAACPAAAQSLAECATVHATAAEQSAEYGTIPVFQEVVGLQAQTTYRFRLIADNRFEYEGAPEGGQITGAEGQLTTAPAPQPTAITGAVSAITATAATISGSVDPDGEPGVYQFELAVYNGAGTGYGVVASGSLPSQAGPIAESLPLTGLQPGTTYAYRITIKNGYGKAVGLTETFTTAGLPEVLSTPLALTMLAVPKIVFPKPVTTSVKCEHGHKPGKDGKCVRVKKKRKQGRKVPREVAKSKRHGHKARKSKPLTPREGRRCSKQCAITSTRVP